MAIVLANSMAEVSPNATEALVQFLSLSGNVLCESKFDIKLRILDIKRFALPMVLPDASTKAQLKLFFDGNELNDDQTLATLGIELSDQISVSTLVYDPDQIAIMELNALYRHAVERSRLEAAEARKKKARLIEEQKMKAEAEYRARGDQPQGPLLMLAAEPANAPKRHIEGKATNSEGASEISAPYTQAESMLMLTAPPLPSDLQSESKPLEVVPSCTSISPVLSDWQEKAKAIFAGYDSFFDHISFRKGWKEPPFSREEAAPLFIVASRIVARARIEMDARNDGLKLRQPEGSSRDWMHSPECATLLKDDSNKFLVNLVHATFKDAHGYVEGLSEGEIDGFIARYGSVA